MRHLQLPRGGMPLSLPVLGLGTWRLGESRATRGAEIASVRLALELGYRLIDTAEMYGEGGAEGVVGTALNDAIRAGDVRRDEVIVVSKVYPHNASLAGTRAACDRSRRRLGLDNIDVYLLHWRGQHPLGETVEAMQALAAAGHIRRWGAATSMSTTWRNSSSRARSARSTRSGIRWASETPSSHCFHGCARGTCP